MTKQSNQDNFGNGLGILIGIVGAVLGFESTSHDPDTSSGIGAIVGFILGYLGGRVAATILSLVLRILIVLFAIAILLFRIFKLIEFFGS